MYHLHVRWVSRTQVDSAARRFEYISRTGRYQKRPDKVRRIYSGCMPVWAHGTNAAHYWRAADNPANRTNARQLYTIECALPKALTPDQQNRLAIDFMKEVAGFSVEPLAVVHRPFTLAVHEGNGKNPHFHALLSTSIKDKFDRSAAQWFRRAHPKNAAAGGARRCRYMGTHSWLLRVRKAWAIAANMALTAVGLKPALDHRSHADRGIDEIPGVHAGPGPKARPNSGRALRSKFRDRTLAQLAELDACAKAEADKKQKELDILLAAEAEEERVIEATRSDLSQQLLKYRRAEIVAASTCWLSVESLDLDRAMQARIQVGVHDKKITPELDGEWFSFDMKALDNEVTHELGADWVLLQSGRRLWMWHPSKDGFIVAGGGFLATNSSGPELLDAFAKVARLSKMTFSHGKAAPAVELSVESKLAAEQIVVQWTKRAGAAVWPSVAPRSRRP